MSLPKKIIFATSNQHKLREVKLLFPKDVLLVSLADIGFNQEIEETGETIEENAVLKAQTIYNQYKTPVIAEDTGLEVYALNMQPGVYTARYAGSDCDADKNMDLLLRNMKNQENRRAQFKTVATFIDENSSTSVEGIVLGEILKERTGSDGFGYDPIFMPAGFKRSFAQMTEEEKNVISHRGIAMKKLLRAIKKI